MIPDTFYKENDVLQAVNYLPSISIILPFEPKMALKRELEYNLQRAVDKVKRQLIPDYSDETVSLVIKKLKRLITNLNFSSYKQSIAIFVSPLFEKVYYLDIPVEEKIVIDESFEIRDLVYSKKDIHKYLILVLSGECSRIYLGNSVQFIRLVSNTPEHIKDLETDRSSRVANFSDPSDNKEVRLEKFFRQVDHVLSIILKAYALPMFIMGTYRTIGHFKKVSHHTNRINGYVYGNFEESSETDIRKAIAPRVSNWKKVKEDDLLHQLDVAAREKKVSTGIQEVWKDVTYKKGRLLVVEKNFKHAAQQGDKEEIIYRKDESVDIPFYIKDAVDDVIEKMLENGGDVEFVGDGVLDAYGHIALIRYY